MLLKTYRAPDLATALAEARAELGPDALVLATTEVPGRLGLSGIEVTVGAARPALGAPAGDGDTVRHLAREVERLRSRMDISPAPSAPAAAPQSAAAGDGRAAPDTPKISTGPALRAAVAALVASGLSDDLAERFARIASRALPAGGDPKGLAAEMIRLQAVRRTRPGVAFPSDDRFQKEFEAEFLYEETEDQLTVLEEIKSRARAISAQSSDHHVSDLADFVLVLASMMKDRDKRAEPGEPLPGPP
jgi:hypothetical protein